MSAANVSDVDRADVVLRPLDETLLPLLLQAAVADADPDEVMPAVPGPAGWTAARREAFVAFHRSRWKSGDEAVPETTYAVLVSGRVAGAARLAAVGENDLEVGLWLGRSYRSRGVGSAALEQAVTEARARGAHRLIATTTSGNVGACRVLSRAGAAIRQLNDFDVEAKLEL